MHVLDTKSIIRLSQTSTQLEEICGTFILNFACETPFLFDETNYKSFYQIEYSPDNDDDDEEEMDPEPIIIWPSFYPYIWQLTISENIKKRNISSGQCFFMEYNDQFHALNHLIFRGPDQHLLFSDSDCRKLCKRITKLQITFKNYGLCETSYTGETINCKFPNLISLEMSITKLDVSFFTENFMHLKELTITTTNNNHTSHAFDFQNYKNNNGFSRLWNFLSRHRHTLIAYDLPAWCMFNLLRFDVIPMINDTMTIDDKKPLTFIPEQLIKMYEKKIFKRLNFNIAQKNIKAGTTKIIERLANHKIPLAEIFFQHNVCLYVQKFFTNIYANTIDATNLETLLKKCHIKRLIVGNLINYKKSLNIFQRANATRETNNFDILTIYLDDKASVYLDYIDLRLKKIKIKRLSSYY